jgi:hypothetical protein
MRVQRKINERPQDRQYLEHYCQWKLSVGNGKAQTYNDENIIQLPNEIMCDIPSDVLDAIYDDIAILNTTVNISKSEPF